MVNRTFLPGATLCTLVVLGGLAHAQATGAAVQAGQPNQITVPFSDPSRPGTVEVHILTGSIAVRVGSGRDVVVTTTRGGRSSDDDREREKEKEKEKEREREAERRSRARARGDDPDTTGLRRLTQPAGVDVEEENNTISISAPVMMGSMQITVLVPAATNLELRAVNGGEVSVEGVTGSIEVNNVNGSIRLTDVGGAVIAHATNGRVIATLKQVAAGKPMSFTSFNGNVDVTLPATAKANLKMRSDRGDVFTDFDVQTTAAPPRSQTPDTRGGDDRRQRDRERDRGNRPDARYRVEMDRAIYGTVNGGGPDFELRTFNGNIYLRKSAR